ncbi:MAG: VWA domain-containing protein [Elusimicrobia bacterium]|nr:VWA domain-containing protein [Elusimicrobiota bacterium]
MKPLHYPFTAIVGQSRLKRALLINAIDPLIGGVLVRGQKGSAKTTAVRGLARLLGAGAPLLELPLGCTEDRLLGSFDLELILKKRKKRFLPGLLAQAHDGILYVDEVNLLSHHLVDLLLDAAASGFVRVEREGFSLTSPSRFILVGSMNPEEGELRPQLLDRFGLSIETDSVSDPEERVEVTRRRLAFDLDPAAFCEKWAAQETDLKALLLRARGLLPRLDLSESQSRDIAAICVESGVQGLRADLVIYRSARALAALAGKAAVEAQDVEEAALLALPHRRQKHLTQSAPPPPPKSRPSSMGESDGAQGGSKAAKPSTEPGKDSDAAETSHAAGKPHAVKPYVLGRSVRQGKAEPGRRQSRETTGVTGAPVALRAFSGKASAIAWDDTLKHAAVGDAGDGALSLDPGQIKEHIREFKTGALVLFVVDASGSMNAHARMKAAKTAALSLLVDAYQRRDQVGLIAFRAEGAELLLPPTRSAAAAEKALAEMMTGGRTPLAAGIRLAEQVISRLSPQESLEPFVVLITDGRPTVAAGEDPLAETLALAEQFRKRRIAGLVIDTESGAVRLGFAKRIAESWGAHYAAPESL